MVGKRIRTRGGICLGESVPIRGRRGVRMRQGRNEDDILPEEFAEYVTGRKVERIIYQDEVTDDSKLNNQLPTLSC